MKSQVLHIVGCYVSGREAAEEIGTRSLLGLKGLRFDLAFFAAMNGGTEGYGDRRITPRVELTVFKTSLKPGPSDIFQSCQVRFDFKVHWYMPMRVWNLLYGTHGDNKCYAVKFGGKLSMDRWLWETQLIAANNNADHLRRQTSLETTHNRQAQWNCR